MIKEAVVTKNKLDILLANLKQEDKEECLASMNQDDLSDFYNYCLNTHDSIYFLENEFEIPLALGGVLKFKNGNKKIGKIWLIETLQAEKERIKIFKYIKEKIKLFKKNYEILFNFIYKSNFKSLKWLSKLNFKVIEINNPQYRIFYYSKGDTNCDLRYFTSKQLQR